MRSQCLSFIALLAINSRRGHVSLKSSIFFFKSLNACHSFRPLGSLRHLHELISDEIVEKILFEPHH